MIKLDNINKYYLKNTKRQIHALKDISLELPDKGLVCVLGESGSGKTTFLNVLGCQDIFHGGTLTIGEESFTKYQMNRMEKLRNETFGYVFQNYYLLKEHTVFYNVKLALSRLGYSDREQSQIVNEALKRVGMKRYGDRLVGELSGGQQQRVAIARAIVGNPKVILADEPTGNLDSDNTEIVMQLLKELSLERLVVVVTHDRKVAERYAERIIEFKKGGVIGDRENQPECDCTFLKKNSPWDDSLPVQSKKSGLSIKEIKDMAYGNIKMLGKRRILLAVIMIFTAIIATLGMMDYVNQNHTGYKDRVTKDSHIVHIKCNWVEGLSDEDFLYFANLFYQKAVQDNEYYEYAATEARLTLQNNEYEQLSNLSSGLGDCAFVDVALLDEDDYIYGERPVFFNDIVVDRLLLDRLMKSDAPIADLYVSLKDFLGESLYDYTFDVCFNIVGICDTGEPTIYGMENAIMSISYKDYKYAFPEQLESVDINLADDEVLLSDKLYDKLFKFNQDEEKLFGIGMINGVTYKVVGTISDSLGVDFVLNKSQHDNIRRIFFSTKKGFYVYTDDVDAAIAHYQKMGKEFDNTIDDFISINVPYDDEVNEIEMELEENQAISPEMRNSVYLMVIIISIFTIYFTMKSDSRRRGNEVAVYRLMGIPKRNIKAVYLLEMTILTIRICATAVIITGIVVKLMTSIPSLEMTLYFPWWILGAVIMGFIVINGLISVAPVAGLLRKPPVHFVE